MDLTVPDYGGLYKKTLLKYMCFSYSSIGEWLDKRRFKRLSGMLYQADIEMTPGMFISLCLLTAALSAVFVFIISDILLTYVIESLMAVPLSLMVASVTFSAVIGGFFFYLLNRINIKKVEIERDLPFALSYMSIMASAGSTPLKVLASVSIQSYGHISNEFQKMGYRVYFLGEDCITAINNLANNTPSRIFRDICLELGNIIHSGTGLPEYLAEKSQDLISIKRISMREFMEDLSLLAEIYLVIVLFTILSVIAIPIIGVFGLTLISLSANHMFVIFTYILLPLANVLFLALLEVKYSTIP